MLIALLLALLRHLVGFGRDSRLALMPTNLPTMRSRRNECRPQSNWSPAGG